MDANLREGEDSRTADERRFTQMRWGEDGREKAQRVQRRRRKISRKRPARNASRSDAGGRTGAKGGGKMVTGDRRKAEGLPCGLQGLRESGG
jgi:hypothetical protein